MKNALIVVLGLFGVLTLTLAAFGLPVGPSLALLAQGAFGDQFGVSRTLVKATPLILVGLGMTIAWRARIYNIGGEGQYVLGGIFGAALAKMVPAIASVPGLSSAMILLISAVGGGLYAMLAGWLSIRRGVDVVIGTILLNFVALQLLSYLVSGPLQEAARTVPMTDALPDAAMLPRFSRQADAHFGILIAMVMAVAIGFFLFRTVAGYRLRVVGDSPGAARANRIPADRVRLAAMALSGALCGLAGGIELCGLAGRLGTGFAQQWGFIGIPVALLGGLNPYGVLLSAGYFGALFAGSENLARFTNAGTTMLFVIQAVAVLGLVGFRSWAERRREVSA